MKHENPMDIQTFMQNHIAAHRAKSLAESDQLTLGEIILKCEQIAERDYRQHDGSEPDVCFDFEYLVPADLDSWRGDYSELALGFTSDGEGPPLSQFIAMLKGAVGKTYEGYKGGSFTMSRHTPVWVANYGNAGNTAIIDVVDCEYMVVLMTAYREW